MEQDGVSGGLEAVKLLSDLLFGQPGPGTASNGSTLSLPSLSGSVLEEALNLPAPGYGMGLQVCHIPPPPPFPWPSTGPACLTASLKTL